MCRKVITKELLDKFQKQLYEDEKSSATIEKYLRDVKYFYVFVGDDDVNKDIVMKYKSALGDKYAVASANSMITALNCFLRFAGWNDCCVKQFKRHKEIYCPEEKELTKGEYIKLVKTAKACGNERLSLILETICGTGIRVSELKYITVEAIKNEKAQVKCKGKIRTIFIVPKLKNKLQRYIKKENIKEGSVFITRNGNPLSRSNIWREMKALCDKANVLPSKVFPHNLRHLFAKVFYSMEKDIVKLADLLGHASVDTTRIYIITSGEEHRNMMEKMKLIL